MIADRGVPIANFQPSSEHYDFVMLSPSSKPSIYMFWTMNPFKQPFKFKHLLVANFLVYVQTRCFAFFRCE